MMINDMVTLVTVKKHFSSVLTLPGSNVEEYPQFHLRADLSLFQDLVNGSMFILATSWPTF